MAGQCWCDCAKAMTDPMMCNGCGLDEADNSCATCGGTGVYDGECECGDDTCCCLVPTGITCPECGGTG